MKMKYIEGILAFLLVFVMLFNAVGMAVDAFFYDVDELPTGKLLFSEQSPEKSKTLAFYLVEIEDVNTGVRGEVSYINEDGETETRNIYWQVGAKTAEVEWKGENQVVINESEINLKGEPYDSRTQIILPEHSAKNRTMNDE